MATTSRSTLTGSVDGTSVLYVLLRCGGQRYAVDAREVRGFLAAGGGAESETDRPVVVLADVLGVRPRPGRGRRPEQVRLERGGRLEVDEVERIVAPGPLGVMELPALLRLTRPVYQGVLVLEDLGVIPLLNLAAVVQGVTP